MKYITKRSYKRKSNITNAEELQTAKAALEDNHMKHEALEK